MKPFGKTIRLFLVDGTPNGITTAELSNWTGIGVKVPKIKIKEYYNRPEFKKPGVYILIGRGSLNEDAAYIGEAEVIAERLVSHIAGKDFWNEVIFFTSKDNYLNKASVKYLENRLHELATIAKRFSINQNIPTQSGLSEAEKAELEEFLENVKLLTSSLGYKIFEKIEQTVVSASHPQIYHCRNGAGAFSTGSPSTEGFLVYAGSLFIISEQASFADSIRAERQKMFLDGKLKVEGEYYKLLEDYIFSSSSRAASATLSRAASGPIEWTTKEGVQLKQFNG